MTADSTTECRQGLEQLSQGDLVSAADSFERALVACPNHPDALHYLGVIAFQNGRFEKAISLMEASLKAYPQNSDAENNLGSAYLAIEKFDLAEHALRRAIALTHQNATYHFNLGNVLFTQKRLAEAVHSYRTAIDQRPNYPEALCNLGIAYRDLENLAAATKCFEKAFQFRPTYAEVAYNLANAYRDACRLSDAEHMIRQAIKLNPSNAKAYNSLGNILSESTKSDLAVAEFETAATLDPQSLPMASNVLSCMQYVPGITNAALQKASSVWVQKFTPLFKVPGSVRSHKDPAKKLRVGFVSPDFGRHPCGFLSVRMFENLNSEEIHPVIFSTRRTEREDDISRRIGIAAEWRRVLALADTDLISTITAAEIDILIDMSGHTSGHRLGVFAHKPAPLQMSWLGYVGATGLSTIDYIIADRWHTPPGQDASGPEQFLRLKDGYVCFEPPADIGDVVALPALSNGYVTFGSLNNATKLNAAVIESYAVILRQVERSRLILRFRGLDDPGVTAHIYNQFQARGIEQTRIDIRGYAKHQKFLATYNEIDLALDTFPYSGGLTTCEALMMGVPVVTFRGQTFAGRHSTSHMSNAGLPDFVTDDRSGFEHLAVTKARDLQSLASLRSGMRARLLSSPLCDGARFAASFSEALRETWQRYCSSSP